MAEDTDQLTPQQLSRRRFLKRAALGIGGALAAAAGAGANARYGEPAWLRVTRLEMPIPGLAPAFDGLRLAQISDLHSGPLVPVERLLSAADKVNELQPHVVAITGDFLGYFVAYTSEVEAVLARLSPSVIKLAVLGNHDHWTGAEQVRQALVASGVRELRNDVITLEMGAARLHFAGVDDAWEGKQDISRVLAGLQNDADPAILLAHEPDPADEYAQTGRFALQLSGHSHGGQVRLPFIGAPFLPYLAKKYPAGLYQVGAMTLYTNRGLAANLPVRFGCPPEITLFTLRASPLAVE